MSRETNDLPGFKLDGVRVGHEAPARFQVVGMRCSGTNFVSHLIFHNTGLSAGADLGWKHAFPTASVIPADLLVVVVVRSPLDWLRGLYLRPWHFRDQSPNLSFSAFIRQEVDTVTDADFWSDELERAAQRMPDPLRRLKILGRRFRSWILNPFAALPGTLEAPPATVATRPLQYDRHPITGETIAHPVAMRTAKLTAYLGYLARDCSAVEVRYEDVRDRPQAFLAALARKFGLVLGPYVPVENWLGHHSDDIGRKLPQEISAEDRKFLASVLDRALESRLGYNQVVDALGRDGNGDRLVRAGRTAGN